MGGKGGGNTSSGTSTTTTSPDPQAMQAYRDVLSRAQNVGNLPYVPYKGELVAGLNPQQYMGIGQINQYAQSAQPTMNYAINAAEMAASPITQNQIQYYTNPWTQNVVNTTAAQFANQNIQQAQGLRGSAIAQGALGGDRAGVAQAELANQQNLAQAPVIAGLESQGYLTGLNTALTEQQALANSAYSLGNLGVAQQGAGLSGANAVIGAGTLQQQTQQAQDISAYQQFLNQQAFPYQQTGWLAGIDTGVGSNMGGTSTSNFSMTGPSPSAKGQIGGGALSGLGMLGKKGMNRGGRVNGMYRGGGVLGSDRQHLQGGGIAGPGAGVSGWPYAMSQGYIPTVPLTHGPGPPQAHAPTPNMPSRPPGGQMPKIGEGGGGGKRRPVAGQNPQGGPDTGGNQPLVGPPETFDPVTHPDLEQTPPIHYGTYDPNDPTGALSSGTQPAPPQTLGASGLPIAGTNIPGIGSDWISTQAPPAQPGKVSQGVNVPITAPNQGTRQSPPPTLPGGTSVLPPLASLQPGQGPVGQQFAQVTDPNVMSDASGSIPWGRDPNTNVSGAQISAPAAPAAPETPASPMPSSDALNFQVPGADQVPGMFAGMGDQFPDTGGVMGVDVFGGMGGFAPMDVPMGGDLGGGADMAAMDMPDMSLKGADGGRINGYQAGGSAMAALPGGMGTGDPGGMSPVEPRFSNPLGDYIYGPDFGTAVLPSDRDMSSAVGSRRGGGVLGYQEGGDVEGDWNEGGDFSLMRIADRPDNASFLRGAQIMTPAQTRALNPLGPVNTLSWAANNPGAVGNIPRAMSPVALGQIGTIQRLPGTSGPAKMAVFDDPVMGGAAGVGVLSNTYGGKTLGEALGPHGYGETPSDIRSVLGRAGGISPNTVITPEFLRSEAGQRFLPEQWRMEGGGQNIMTPSQLRDATTFGLTNIPRDPDVPGGGRDMGAVYGPSQVPSPQGFADPANLPQAPDWSQTFSDPNVSPEDSGAPAIEPSDVPVGSIDGSFDIAGDIGDMGDFRRGGMVRGYDDGGDVAPDDGSSDVLPVRSGVVPLPRSRPQIDDRGGEQFYGMAPPSPPDYSDWDREAAIYSPGMPWEDKVAGTGAGLAWSARGLTQEKPELLPKILPYSDRLGPPLAESDYPHADRSFRTLTPPSYEPIPWAEQVRRFDLGRTNDRTIRSLPDIGRDIGRYTSVTPLPHFAPRGERPSLRSILRSRDVLDQLSGSVHARGGGVRGYDDGGAPNDSDTTSIADVGDVGGGVGGGDQQLAEVHWSDQIDDPARSSPLLTDLNRTAASPMDALITDRQMQQDRADAATAQQAFRNYPDASGAGAQSSDEAAATMPDTAELPSGDAGPAPAQALGVAPPDELRPADDFGASVIPPSLPFMVNASPTPPVTQPLHVGAQPFWAGLGQANVGRGEYQTGPENAQLIRPDQWPAFVNANPDLANATRMARPDYYNNRFFTRVKQSEADPLAYAARDVVERQLGNSDTGVAPAGGKSSFTQGLGDFADWLANRQLAARGRRPEQAPEPTPESAPPATPATPAAQTEPPATPSATPVSLPPAATTPAPPAAVQANAPINVGQASTSTGTYPHWKQGNYPVDEYGRIIRTSPRRAANVADYVTGSGNQSYAVPGDILNQARQVAMSGGPAAVRDFMQREGFPQSGPWCGEFAASVVRAAGYSPPSNPETASNWRNFGAPIPWSQVQPGDIAIRKSSYITGGYTPTGSPGSHVTFVDGVNPRTGQFYGLGGNQGGSREVTRIPFDPANFEFRRFGSTTTAGRQTIDADTIRRAREAGVAINRGQYGSTTGIYPGSSPWNTGQADQVRQTRETAPAGGGGTALAGGGLNQEAYRSIFGRGMLAGHEADIISAARNAGISPSLLAGVIAEETGGGTSHMIRQLNNPGGVFQSGRYTSFPNIQEGIASVARTIAHRLPEGGGTISGLGKIYAPPGAANDPRGTNAEWPAAVTSFERRLRQMGQMAGLQAGGVADAPDADNSGEGTSMYQDADNDAGAPLNVAYLRQVSPWTPTGDHDGYQHPALRPDPNDPGSNWVSAGGGPRGDFGGLDHSGNWTMDPYPPRGGGVAGRPDLTSYGDSQGDDYGGRGRGRSGWDFSSGSKIWPAMVTAGAAMMASGSPFFGQALGEGLLAGANAYSNASAAERTMDIDQRKIDLEAQKIYQNQKNFEREQGWKELQPGVIGEDEYGRKYYGVRDPKTGGFRTIDPQTGVLAPLGLPGVPGGPGGPDIRKPQDITRGLIPASQIEMENAALAKLPQDLVGEKPDRDESVLEGLNPNEASIVRGLTDYQINPNSISIRGGRREKLTGLARQYSNDTYDQSLYPAHAAAIKEFLAGGLQSPAGQMTAGNTAILHAGEMSDALESLKSQGSGPLLAIGAFGNELGLPFIKHWATDLHNRGIVGTGTPEAVALQKFETARNHFAEEVTKFYAGSQGSEAERDRALKALDAAKTLPELRAAVATEAGLMKDKVRTLQNRQMAAMGPGAWRRAMIQDPEGTLIYQNSRTALDRITERQKLGDRPETAAPAQPGTQPQRSGQPQNLPKGVPADSVQSPSSGRWKAPDGTIYNTDGSVYRKAP